MFKNEKLENIKKRINEVIQARQDVEQEIAELEQVVEQAIELYAEMKLEKSGVDKAKINLKQKEVELQELYVMESKLQQTLENATREALPEMQEAQKNHVKKLQAEYDKQAKVVEKARYTFLRELKNLGAIARKYDGQYEISDLSKKAGRHLIGASVREREIYFDKWDLEENYLGISLQRQQQSYNGVIVEWAVKDNE